MPWCTACTCDYGQVGASRRGWLSLREGGNRPEGTDTAPGGTDTAPRRESIDKTPDPAVVARIIGIGEKLARSYLELIPADELPAEK